MRNSTPLDGTSATTGARMSGLSASYELPCGEPQGRALPEDSVMHPWERCQNQPGLGHTRTAALPGLASPRPWRWGTPGERRITGAARAC